MTKCFEAICQDKKFLIAHDSVYGWIISENNGSFKELFEVPKSSLEAIAAYRWPTEVPSDLVLAIHSAIINKSTPPVKPLTEDTSLKNRPTQVSIKRLTDYILDNLIVDPVENQYARVDLGSLVLRRVIHGWEVEIKEKGRKKLIKFNKVSEAIEYIATHWPITP